MKVRFAAWIAAACLLLTGCASLLERDYSTVEPHVSKFWESEAAGTLRAESYQDIVNDLLILIGQHTETATLRLYNFEDDLSVSQTLERATNEVKQETAMGAYAVEFITFTSQAQRGYYEVPVQISYRRTAEQVQAVVNATSTEAVYSLLSTAVAEGRSELAVRIGYWREDDQARVEDAMARLREELGLTQTPEWSAYYYPAEGEVGLVEFALGGSESSGDGEQSEEVPADPGSDVDSEKTEKN